MSTLTFAAAPLATVTEPQYMPITATRLRPLTGRLLDEWLKPPAEESIDRWELTSEKGGASWEL